MDTNISGVDVKISTCREKLKHQVAVKDWTCTCGSNTYAKIK